jgi:hypothetical protein
VLQRLADGSVQASAVERTHPCRCRMLAAGHPERLAEGETAQAARR